MIRRLSILAMAFFMSIQIHVNAVENESDLGEISQSSKKRKLEEKVKPEVADEIYMYSDNRPKTSHVFTLDLSEQKWEQEDFDSYEFIDRRRFQVYETVEKILEAEKFVSLNNWCAEDEEGGRISGVFGRFISRKLNDVFIVGCQYRDKFLSPQFKKTGWDTDSRVLRPIKTKWNIREEESDKPGLVKVLCTEFSWRWVDLSIHFMNKWIYSYKNVKDVPTKKLTERLYANIRKKGLENSIMRISVIVNKDSHYSFNIIYDNESQENKARTFLLKLKEDLNEKFNKKPLT